MEDNKTRDEVNELLISAAGLFANKEYDECLEKLDSVIELNSRESSAYNGRGHVFFAKGEYEKAIKEYDRAINIDDSFGIYFRARGEAKD